ncbi:helix-turn-helix domain-containing protein [Longimicrobium terrae]|uniref:Transcriptional regulator with XRE-family HTH domain n=1 Tax=Longimicrobium terrae TaxID=1639882 RepID=A0A841GUB1_9BACT|nr:helix-turn-helix transcriptional regulator [Longimicrobium terrae]MBB4635923.1 transcriptional regulator with XRE-family HTH domain [Longimicrobium terrae]MBB6070319.1 transcriptional regulator with XRE-family HTH domain [Longimicrobium terrae]NNC30820.1 helix-turn-helix transcriptional regulator [Longimicrobium terrae]
MTHVPLQQIRAAANAAQEQTSLREAAREVGMSPTGLSNFLRGARPSPGTLRKLQSWYVLEGARHVEMSASDGHAAISLLTEGIPAEYREHCKTEFLVTLGQVYREDRPDWVRRLLVRAAQPSGAHGNTTGAPG